MFQAVFRLFAIYRNDPGRAGEAPVHTRKSSQNPAIPDMEDEPIMPNIESIYIRDPFILPWQGTYYLYAAQYPTFIVRTSTDLIHWSEPTVIFEKPADFWSDRDYWAPECHAYTDPADGKTRFYLFASFKAADRCRGTQILCAEEPTGPFVPLTAEPVTPRDWECLDGTLWIEDGTPYMVFCHEWLQIGDGEICMMPLSHDLTTAIGEPVVLFHASAPRWVRPVRAKTEFVTDGPFLYRTGTGELLMLWSSFGDKGYAETAARSASGKLSGPWIQEEEPLMPENGGHGMLFRTFDGKLNLVIHAPNAPNGAERAHYFPVEDCGDHLTLGMV